MKTKVFLLALVISTTFTAQAQMSQYLADTLSSLFQQRAQLLNIKGMASAVVFPDGSVWTDAYGHYGNNTLTTDLLYDIGSNTKTMTAGVILLLAEEGKLSLDDTLYHYLQPIPHVGYGITIRQVLNHTSGLFNYTNHPDFHDWLNTSWNGWIESDSILYKYMDTAYFQPGENWGYSNSGYILLGLIIEKIEGKPYHQVLREKLFTPLKLHDTHTAFYDIYGSHHVGTWMSSGNYLADPPRSFMSAAWSAGAVIATPVDLARWSHEFHGGRVLQEASFQQMMDTIQISSREGAGLGVFVNEYKGRTYYGHGGTTLQNSAMEYSVEGKFSVATFCIEQGQYNPPIAMTNFLIDLMENELPNIPHTALTTDEYEENTLQLSAYPNPSNDQITLTTDQSGAMEIQVYDAAGALVKQVRTQNGAYTLSKNDLGAGLFIATVRMEETGQMAQQRLLIH